MKDRIPAVLALLAIGCFAMPILGGCIATDSLPLEGNPLVEILDGQSLPTLQHALLALPFAAAMIVLLLQRKVLQVPSRTMGLLLAAFFGILVATFIPASFKGTSIPSLLEWLSYAVAFYAVVAGTGRRLGPRVLMLAIFAGCSVTSLRGIREYGQMRQIDPTWRIVGGWVDGNQLAAVLVVGILIGIGLTITETRLTKLLCGIFLVPQLIALVLTKSRGGLLVLVLGLILLAVMLIAWRSKGSSKSLVKGAALLVVAAVFGCCILAPVLQVAAPVATSASSVSLTAEGAGLGRLSLSNVSSDESVYFRRLLWKGTLPLLRDYSSGVGIGNYRYFSGKSGLTTQTQVAHESYLQLATEATVFAPLALAAALLLWAMQVCRGPGGLPNTQNVLRASAAAAVFSILAHSVVDSDLYFFGLGMLLFVLIGVALVLSADAVAPELTPAALRRTAAGAIALLIVAMFYSGYVELLKARLRFEVVQRDTQSAVADAGTLMSMAPYDSDAWDLASRVASTPQEAESRLETAVSEGPSTKTLRALAYLQEQAQPGDATTLFNRALAIDPNNMVTLFQLMRFQQAINPEEARQTAERLIKVEDTLYFKIRSLPDIVPTETFAAREYLAGLTSSSQQKVELLMPALRGYLEYAHRTVGVLISQHATDYGGETPEMAKDKMNQAVDDAKEIQREAMTTGDRADAAEAVRVEADFNRALAKLAGSSTR